MLLCHIQGSNLLVQLSRLLFRSLLEYRISCHNRIVLRLRNPYIVIYALMLHLYRTGDCDMERSHLYDFYYNRLLRLCYIQVVRAITLLLCLIYKIVGKVVALIVLW